MKLLAPFLQALVYFILTIGSVTAIDVQIYSGLRTVASEEEIAAMEKLVGRLSEEEIEIARRTLSNSAQFAAKTGKDLDSLMHLQIAKLLKITKDDPQYKVNKRAFWCLYSHRFFCNYKYRGDTVWRKKHILKRILDFKIPSQFRAFLGKFGKNLNVNDVEMVNGRPETLLDYLYKIKDLEDFKEVNINHLIKYVKRKHNAKTAEEVIKELKLNVKK